MAIWYADMLAWQGKLIGILPFVLLEKKGEKCYIALRIKRFTWELHIATKYGGEENSSRAKVKKSDVWVAVAVEKRQDNEQRSFSIYLLSLSCHVFFACSNKRLRRIALFPTPFLL